MNFYMKDVKKLDLHKKVNIDDLIYRYKGNTVNVNFEEFNNTLDITDKIRDGKIDLADVKNNQEKFNSCLEEIKKETKKKKIKKAKKKTLCTILKCFTKQERKPLNFKMVILQ